MSVVRAFKKAQIPLGAYQILIAEPYEDESGQFTKSGHEPMALDVTISSPLSKDLSKHIQLHAVRLILSEQAQRDLIALLDTNLHQHSIDNVGVLNEFARRPYTRIER